MQAGTESAGFFTQREEPNVLFSKVLPCSAKYKGYSRTPFLIFLYSVEDAQKVKTVSCWPGCGNPEPEWLTGGNIKNQGKQQKKTGGFLFF